MQVVAFWSAVRGTVVLSVGVVFAVLLVRGESAQTMVNWLVDHVHVDRKARFIALFLEWSQAVTPGDWLMFWGVLLAYVTLHAFEAYGLWRERRWAEWLAALSGGIYLPVEGYELMRHPGWFTGGLLAGNVCIVGYMAWMLWTGRRSVHRRQNETLPGL